MGTRLSLSYVAYALIVLVIMTWSLSAQVSTTTSVTSSANPSVFGQPVTFTATVSTAGMGTPTGTVTFFDGPSPLGAPVMLNVSGQAQLVTSSLSVGSHSLTVQYSGGSGFNPSNGSLSGGQTVNKANTTVAIAANQPNPVGTGTAVTFTATVNPVAPGGGTRTGTVTFLRNGSPICSNVTINASAQATCTITFTLAGNYNITATYGGSVNFNGSNGPTFVQQVVGPTAADVSVEGRVVTTDGRGIASARLTVSDSHGQRRMVLSNPFGYYRVSGLEGGRTYTISVSAKGFTFDPSTIVRSLADNATDVDFIGHR